MAITYTIKTAQQKLSSLVRESESHPITLTRQGEAVAVVLSMERMEAIAETMETLADPKAMSAIRRYKEGHGELHDLEAIDAI